MAISFLLLVAVLAMTPSMIMWSSGRRRLAIAQAETRMARAVTRFEKLMLSSVLKDGDACHDFVFKALARIQYIDRLRLSWSQNKPMTREVQKLWDRIEEELMSCTEARLAVRQFTSAYQRKLRAQFPIAIHINRLGLVLARNFSSALSKLETPDKLRFLFFRNVLSCWNVIRRVVSSPRVVAIRSALGSTGMPRGLVENYAVKVSLTLLLLSAEGSLSEVGSILTTPEAFALEG